MQNDQSLPGASDGVPRCRRYRQMTITEQGLVLGAGTLLVTRQIHEPTRIWPKKTLIDYDPAAAPATSRCYAG